MKIAFINAGIGKWYSTGSERLKGSLIQHGFNGDIITWVDQWPNPKYPRNPVYNVKAAAFDEAISRGYQIIIWGDSSITARKNTAPFLDHIREHGYWIGQSGYRASQVSTDSQLKYFGVSRDWAHNVPDCATGLFGFDIGRPEYMSVLSEWIQSAKDGAFSGSRLHGGGSSDPRFLHGRQDQAAMSIILGKQGINLRHWIEFARFKWDKQDTVFHCEGM